MKIPFALAGMSVGFGLIGSKIGSEHLAEAGETSGKFIAPAVNIFAGGYVIKELRELKKKINTL